MRIRRDQSDGTQKGIILVAVLWIVAVIGFIGATFSFQTATDNKVVYYMRHRMQAQMLAESAIERARVALALDSTIVDGLDEPWADAPDEFADRTIEGLGGGVYSVIGRPQGEDDETVHYGLEDECGKVNINTASRDMLVALPGVTEAIADAIIDWRDADDAPGVQGAESAYYAALRTPYTCKNERFESIDELLLVRGITSEVLFGEDANRNGRLDANEDDGDETLPDDDRDGQLDMGLYRYVTVWSRTPNEDADGNRRIYLNVQWRQLRGRLNALDLDNQARTQIVNARRRKTFKSTADLLDLPAINEEVYAAIEDRLTVSNQSVLRGLINPNTAPVPVLVALPGVTEDDAAAIVAFRQTNPESTESIAWLIDILGKARFKAVANLLTIRSSQFSCEAVGRFVERPIFKRIRVVLDRSSSPARIVYWQDLTGLGLAYPPPTPDVEYTATR